MSGYVLLLLFFGLLFAGLPVAFSMIFSSGLYFILSDMSLMVMAQRMGGALNSITLLAVPTFIFAGCIMNNGGLTDSLFKAVNTSRVGKLKGGLAYVNVLASLIFAGMSGAALADLGGLGNVELKAMRENGYAEDDAIGITLASAAIGPIFPPSIPLLIYALVASVSGVKILLAGVFPGLLLTIALMITVFIFAKKKNFPRGNINISKKEKFAVQIKGLPALVAPIILLGGLFTGTFSPTELACVAVMYSALVGFTIYRKINMHSIVTSAMETTSMVSNTMFIMAAATVFAFILTVERIPQSLQVIINQLTNSRILLILVVNIVLFIVGMVMDTGIAILIFVPMIVPILTAAGMDPLQIGVMMCFNLVIGLYTPPFGTCLFMASSMTKRPVERIVKAIAPYYITLIIALLLISFIPALTVWLPNAIF